jgi:hypothetical protein
VGLGLAFACGGLMLISTIFKALNNRFFKEVAGAGAAPVAGVLGTIIFKIAAIPMSMLLLLLIYWLLPNCALRPTEIVPAAIGVGFLLELLKYVNLLTWPYLRAKLSVEYGLFYDTVTIILGNFWHSWFCWRGRMDCSSIHGRGCSGISLTVGGGKGCHLGFQPREIRTKVLLQYGVSQGKINFQPNGNRTASGNGNPG